MSKAFTLFELIISLILFTFITSLLSKPLMDFYHLNFTALHTNNLITQAHLNLLKIEKLIQNCINITFSQNTLKCLLKDELISLKDNKLYLINSALILENNHTLYSPILKHNSKIEKIYITTMNILAMLIKLIRLKKYLSWKMVYLQILQVVLFLCKLN